MVSAFLKMSVQLLLRFKFIQSNFVKTPFVSLRFEEKFVESVWICPKRELLHVSILIKLSFMPLVKI